MVGHPVTTAADISDEQLERMAGWCEGSEPLVHGTCLTIAAALRELVEARRALTASDKDAARYRWLRDTDHWQPPHVLPGFSGAVIRGVKVTNYYNGSAVNHDWLLGAELEALIDAAMEKANGR